MRRIILSAASLLIATAAINAQSYTSYFVDNNCFGYRINPALMGEKSFFGLGVGNINANVNSSIGIGNILFPKQTGTGFVTGLNASVDAKQFLDGIDPITNLGVNVTENILSIGSRRTADKFVNFEINLKSMASASLPKDVFNLLKLGSNDTPFDLSATSMDLKTYAELAFGISKQYSSKVNIGFRVKALVGIESAAVKANKMNVLISGDKWEVDSDAEFKAAAKYIDFGVDDKGNIDWSANFLKSGIYPAGFGAGVDFGVEIYPTELLSIGVAVRDFGAIVWNNNTIAKSVAHTTFTGSSNEIDLSDPSESSIGKDIEDAFNELKKATEFKKEQNGKNELELLPISANAGIRYRMPFWRRLSVGALADCCYYKNVFTYGVRGAATLSPLDWFSLSGSIGTGNYGNSFGVAASLNLLSFNLFLAMDSYLGRVGTYNNISVIPLDKSYERISVGLNLTFGNRFAIFPEYAKKVARGEARMQKKAAKENSQAAQE